jgi:hypothetical protein
MQQSADLVARSPGEDMAEPRKGERLVNSSIIGKIEKARRYAEEPDRVQIDTLHVTFRGEHNSYDVTLEKNQWSCSCHSFSALRVGTCSHIMAIERLLGPMLAEDVPVSGTILSYAN